MARRIYFHIGAPKTGTTFIQSVLYQNRRQLKSQGILFAGDRWLDRVRAAIAVRDWEDDKDVGPAWPRIVDQTREWDQDVIISHEWFTDASGEQAKRALDDLAPAEIHLVFTARDYARQLPAVWQEELKQTVTASFEEFVRHTLSDGPLSSWFWPRQDPVDVLDRWRHDIPSDRIHIVTVPPRGAAADSLWARFATLCGVDSRACASASPRSNQSLSVVEAELLRRVNSTAGEPIQGSRWLREQFANQILAPRGGARLGPPSDAVTALRTRSLRTVKGIENAGYDVVGDLEDLLPAQHTSGSRQPETVTESELAEAATWAIVGLLKQHRKMDLELARMKRRVEQAEGKAAKSRERLEEEREARRSAPVRWTLKDLSEQRPAIGKARRGYRHAVRFARAARRVSSRG